MPSFGTIAVWVYTARAALPLAGATVTLSRRLSDGKNRLLGVYRTDESGATLPLTLETPSVEESLAPGSPLPFATCDVRVEHPNFQRAQVENAQIFPHVLALQQVGLVPLSERQSPLTFTSEVLVTPQPL